MAKRILISFDYDHDRNYRYLLSALEVNRSSLIDFIDATPGEINSFNIGRIKAVLTQKISQATHILVIIGAYANTAHPQRLLIGDRNWQWWEINKGKELGKKFIAVKINRTNFSPNPILSTRATWAMSFNVSSILSAINSSI
ncbi:MAG TPA: TIR domain-containing protein [Methylomirabilota bacterium]|nr:TIR domain-containing protein [Methylomirabilota bacterium]